MTKSGTKSHICFCTSSATFSWGCSYPWLSNLCKNGTKTDWKMAHLSLSQLPPKCVRSHILPHNCWTFSGGACPCTLMEAFRCLICKHWLCNSKIFYWLHKSVENTGHYVGIKQNCRVDFKPIYFYWAIYF